MSLMAEDGPWRPELSLFRAIDMRCEDCGRSKRMQPPEIRRHIADGIFSLVGLHAKLQCKVCRSRGGMGKNVSLFPIEKGH
ncbi:hypothetical protein, partial [Bacillus licheniformis]|uniref:hypothetical protein n=1 Tax=Bacillus licheniformis TaxID=1402 RepID=UPI00237D02AF